MSLTELGSSGGGLSLRRGTMNLVVAVLELQAVCYLALSRQIVGILGSELRIEVHIEDVDLGAASSI